MSSVTNLILITSLADAFPAPAIITINTWLQDRDHLRLELVNAHAGGEKLLECAFYAGAFNGLDLAGFISAIRAAAWICPEYVQLMVRTEGDDKFALIEPLAPQRLAR